MSRAHSRNITITPKGYAILAALDAGTYRTISTAEARRINGTRQAAKLNSRKNGTTSTSGASR